MSPSPPNVTAPVAAAAGARPAADLSAFTPYQRVVIGILAFLQFTIVLDFMIISPLGALLLRDLHIAAKQFGLVVSVYAFSAGASGILAAGFADRFDRKKLLLFFYAGFTVGTALCGLAPTYGFLLMARVVTGVFGGVIGSIVMAIVADLFPLQMRGRVMGVVQTSFAASQVLGLPLGFFLATHLGWHAPFLLIVAFNVVAGVFIVAKLRPITGHLALQRDGSPFVHLLRTATKGRHLKAFGTTMLLATGGFMLMPFGSTFTINNIGVSPDSMSLVYLVTGLCTLVAGPFIGRFSDRVGKYPLFVVGSAITIVMVIIYTHLGRTPLPWVIVVNVLLYVGVTSRIISATALISAVPDPASRGAFMAINAALQQFAGGAAAALAGLIVVSTPSGALERYDVLGWVATGALLVVVILLGRINRMVATPAAAR
jgi:predicted MFS family arabinose efflux permease